MLGYSPKNTYLCSVKRRNQVEPRCAERWHGCGNTEMMSDSTSPLDFFHSNNKKLAKRDQLLLFLILGWQIQSPANLRLSPDVLS